MTVTDKKLDKLAEELKLHARLLRAIDRKLTQLIEMHEPAPAPEQEQDVEHSPELS